MPIDGRAATITRSPGWKPRVILSRSGRCVPTPVMYDWCSNSFSIFGKLSCTSWRIGTKPGFDPILRHGEDGAFGVVEDEVGVLVGLVGVGDDLGGGVDQAAQGRLFPDDARVVLDIGRARHAVDEGGEVGGAADLLELAGPGQFLAQRHEIDGVAPLGELHHPLEDAPVGVAEEGLGRDDGDGGVERLVVEQHGAEHRAFGVEVVRQGALVRGDCGFGHG